MEKPKRDQQPPPDIRLAKAFKFTNEDLIANRMGRLSREQALKDEQLVDWMLRGLFDRLLRRDRRKHHGQKVGTLCGKIRIEHEIAEVASGSSAAILEDFFLALPEGGQRFRLTREHANALVDGGLYQIYYRTAAMPDAIYILSLEAVNDCQEGHDYYATDSELPPVSEPVPVRTRKADDESAEKVKRIQQLPPDIRLAKAFKFTNEDLIANRNGHMTWHQYGFANMLIERHLSRVSRRLFGRNKDKMKGGNVEWACGRITLEHQVVDRGTGRMGFFDFFEIVLSRTGQRFGISNLQSRTLTEGAVYRIYYDPLNPKRVLSLEKVTDCA